MSALRTLLPAISLVASLACCAALAHPFHSSYAEIDWGGDGTQLEIALRVIPEDLEAALSRQRGESVALVQRPPVHTAIENYLRETFQVVNPAGEAQALRLTGFEAGHRETWLYFTVAASRRETLSLRHELLFDEDMTQRNQTRRLWRAASDIMVFTAERPEQALWSPDDASTGGETARDREANDPVGGLNGQDADQR